MIKAFLSKLAPIILGILGVIAILLFGPALLSMLSSLISSIASTFTILSTLPPPVIGILIVVIIGFVVYKIKTK